MNKCPFCNYRYSDASELEKHLLEYHFIDIRSYYELLLSNRLNLNNEKYPLTYLKLDTYYYSDWSTVDNYYEKKQLTSTLQSAISDYYSEILGDRFLQMFLITDNYFNNTLYHTYDDFKSVLKELQKQDRNKIWFLDWNVGYPKIISTNNIKGIKVVTIDDKYNILNSKDFININSWKVSFPEIIPYDQRHHSRYNILNLSIDSRNTKRLRLKDEKDQCIKFYNNNNSCKSLFRLFDSKGNVIETSNLSMQDLTVTKLLLLRNKSFMRLINTVVGELIKTVSIFSDSVFLRNTIKINQDKRDIKLNLSWTPDKIKENYINISIL